MDGGVLAGRSRVEKQFFIRDGFGRDFGGTRLRYIADCLFVGLTPDYAIDQWVDLVNVTALPASSLRKRDQPGKVLIQLESLILAQSERWRQA